MPDAQDHNEERRTELANIWRLEGEVVVDTIRHTLGLKHRSHTVVHKDPLKLAIVCDQASQYHVDLPRKDTRFRMVSLYNIII